MLRPSLIFCSPSSLKGLEFLSNMRQVISMSSSSARGTRTWSAGRARVFHAAMAVSEFSVCLRLKGGTQIGNLSGHVLNE